MYKEQDKFHRWFQHQSSGIHLINQVKTKQKWREKKTKDKICDRKGSHDLPYNTYL